LLRLVEKERIISYSFIMTYLIVQFVEKMLSRAVYEYDDSVDQWAAWIKGFPGVYAQASTIEEARNDLASALEESVLLSLREGANVRGLPLPRIPNTRHATSR